MHPVADVAQSNNPNPEKYLTFSGFGGVYPQIYLGANKFIPPHTILPLRNKV